MKIKPRLSWKEKHNDTKFWFFLSVLVSWWFVFFLSAAWAQTEAPTVAPADITTPTVSVPSLLPTVTPTPPETNATPRTYVVRPGDTLLTVALEIGIDLDDMPCVVDPLFQPDQPLVIGNVLVIPDPGTLCHVVAAGDTLQTLATQYGVAPEEIYQLPWNQLSAQLLASVQLQPGSHLRIPTVVRQPPPNHDAPLGLPSSEEFLTRMLQQPINTSPFVVLGVGGAGRAVVQEVGVVPPNWPYGSGHFVWPLYGWLTQGYRYDHRAVDIAAPLGTLVTAADRGVVVRAGWNDQGYGNFVVIDHNIDYITLYAHLSRILVGEGEVVAKGQPLGEVGSTGNSTGPHLHFEIRDFGRLTNPLELLGR